MFKAIKNYLNNSLKKIEEENNKTFGNTSGKLECCDINRKNNGSTKELKKN
ncbi:MAG: LDCC motif putative metal-binding protein [Clostridium sp.]